MIELIFTACLVTSPETCKDKHLTFVENLNPMQCLMGAQTELAKWNAAHPNWRIGRWKCQSVRTASRDT